MDIVYSVSAAVGGEGFLPVGEKVLLECFSMDDDGIFPSVKSWQAFVRGNFLGTGAYKDYFQPIKPNTIKRWCYPEEDYKHLFAVKVGRDKWQQVNPDDIELEFDYEWFTSKKAADNFNCTSIEIYVTATFKS